ncbi:hypothetical protein C7C46_08835 [Streptomyces tateyamensis]|uniref:Uncharacterized protein n=1 Tax=Streptomyces tateyamensis TaxID=565073 RepID=A0A2V4PHI7_9ACTN|nr:hypothetical protein C7C46_08835 [Streptomyces tateyamensis]
MTPKGSGKPGPLPLNPLKTDNSSPPRASPHHTDDPLFDAFWSAYPRKIGKSYARAAWAKAIKRGADPAAIADAVPRHAAFWRAAGTDPKFIPYPTTWLNGDRYEDQLDTQPAITPQTRQQTYEERGIF